MRSTDEHVSGEDLHIPMAMVLRCWGRDLVQHRCLVDTNRHEEATVQLDSTSTVHGASVQPQQAKHATIR